jgi:hypothetical protein
VELALLTGLGLAAPAGLNAYIPLLVLALTARFSDAVVLGAPFDLITSTPAFAVILLLLTIELVVDKVPGLDHINDLLNTVVRPVAGALLAIAVTSEAVSINPVLAGALGLTAAGSVHAAKSATRLASTGTTFGIFNPVLSFAEDLIAALTSITAVFLPVAVLVFLFGFLAFAVWGIMRRLTARPAPAGPTARSTNSRR